MSPKYDHPPVMVDPPKADRVERMPCALCQGHREFPRMYCRKCERACCERCSAVFMESNEGAGKTVDIARRICRECYPEFVLTERSKVVWIGWEVLS